MFRDAHFQHCRKAPQYRNLHTCKRWYSDTLQGIAPFKVNRPGISSHAEVGIRYFQYLRCRFRQWRRAHTDRVQSLVGDPILVVRGGWATSWVWITLGCSPFDSAIIGHSLEGNHGTQQSNSRNTINREKHFGFHIVFGNPYQDTTVFCFVIFFCYKQYILYALICPDNSANGLWFVAVGVNKSLGLRHLFCSGDLLSWKQSPKLRRHPK